jgi:glycosyltransferase involved in cell wall biosynthesis
MRILIDLQGAQNGSRNRGIGRYSLALARAIVRNKGSHEIFIALNGLFTETIDAVKKDFSEILPDEHFTVFNAAGPVDELSTENSWRVRAAELLRERFITDLAPDFLLVSSLCEGASDDTITSIGQLPSRVPTAVILYDLIPHLYPEKYLKSDAAKKWYYRKIESLKKAGLLLAISDSARREAIDHLGIDPHRIVNISSAAAPIFTKANLTPFELSALHTRCGINRKYVMHSSAFEDRKNFHGLIQAFGSLPGKVRKSLQLVLVCDIDKSGRKSLKDLAAKAGLERDALVLTGYVPDGDLVALYSECHLFVFPSFHEGFGLPPLEAMCCGAATIGSNTSSIPEVIGRRDALFDPGSSESMTALMERALIDEAFRLSLKAHAVIQSGKFNWDQCARRAIEGFESWYQNKAGSAPPPDRQDNIAELIERVAGLVTEVGPSRQDLIVTADSIARNENAVRTLRSFADYGGTPENSWEKIQHDHRQK